MPFYLWPSGAPVNIGEALGELGLLAGLLLPKIEAPAPTAEVRLVDFRVWSILPCAMLIIRCFALHSFSLQCGGSRLCPDSLLCMPHRRPAAQKAADRKAAERKAAVQAELALANRPSRRVSSPKRFDQEEILSSHEAAKLGLSPWPQQKRSRASVGSLASSDDSDED